MNWNDREQVQEWVRQQVASGRSQSEIRSEILRHNSNVGFVDMVLAEGSDAQGALGSAVESVGEVRQNAQRMGQAALPSPLGGSGDDSGRPVGDSPQAQAQAQLDELAEDGISPEEAPVAEQLLAVLGQGGQSPEMLRWLRGQALTENEILEALEVYNAISPNQATSPQELFDQWEMGDVQAWEAIEAVRDGETEEFVHITTSSVSTGDGQRFQVSVPLRVYEAFRSNFNGFEGIQSAVFRAVNTQWGDGVDRTQAPPSAYAGALAVTGGIGPGDRRPTSTAEQLDRSRGMSEYQPSPRAQNEQNLRKYQQLYSRYRNHGLALVAMRDIRLAEQIYQTGEIPDADAARRVQQVFLDGSYNQDAWTNQGDVFDGGMWAELIGEADPSSAYARAGGYGGREAPTIEVPLPDRDTLDESLRVLYRSWFRRNPTAEELSAFAGEINSTIRGEAGRRAAAARQQIDSFNPFRDDPSQLQQSLDPILYDQYDVDPVSSAKEKMRRTAEYMRLFGKMPEGMDEVEYAQTFERAAERFAPGSVVGDEAIRSGMESGSQQTTVGRIFSDAQVWDETEGDSTFLQRMTNAARAIARMT